MNWADYCIIGALGLSILMGLWRGFVAEVLALAGWVAAIWVAWRFGADVAGHLAAVDAPSIRLLLGYGICFMVVLLIGAIVTFLMRKVIAGSGLSGNDRLLGMVFGLVRGLALVTVAVLLLGFTPLPRDPWWHESRLLPAFQGYAQWLSAQLPPEALKYLDLRGLLPQIPPAPQKAPAPAARSTA
jgi:membrane protein required for colicin V production